MSSDHIADKPTAGVYFISPETAARWLAHNVKNRKLNPHTVERYADDMRAGRWLLTGAPIQFAKDGTLLDGQHRLAAIVRAERGLPMFVTRGLNNEAQTVTDTGRKRTVGDQIKIAGMKNHTIIAAVGRVALLWETGRLGKPGTMMYADSNARVSEFIEQEPLLIPASQIAATVRKQGLELAPSAIGTCAWRFMKTGSDAIRVATWFGSLAEFQTTGPGDPKYALLRRLRTAATHRERIPIAEQVSITVRAWNAEVESKQLHRMLTVSRNGAVAIPAVKVWAA